MKIACIGPGTAAALEEARLYADLVPEEYTTEALADTLARSVRKHEKVLILRAAEGNPLLTNKLENEKILYKECPIYRTQYSWPEQQPGRPELQKGALSFDRQAANPGRPVTQDADLIIFGSAGGVRAYLENNVLRDDVQPLCIGALTAAELERLTGRKAAAPDTCSVEGIRQYLKKWRTSDSV